MTGAMPRSEGTGRRHRPLAGRCIAVTRPGTALWHVLLAGLVFVAAGFATAARGAEPGVDELADTFVRIVETAEYGSRPRGAAKWMRPVSLAVVGRPEPDQAAALDVLLERLARVPNLELRRVDPIARPVAGGDPSEPLDFARPGAVFQWLMHLPQHDWTVYTFSGRDDAVFTWRAHVTLVFLPQAAFGPLARLQRFDPRLIANIEAGTTPCAANYFVDPTEFMLRYATVMLRTDLPAWARRRCLHEEIVQAMGLSNDVKDSEITLFDDRPMKRRTELTRYDWMFLDVLYDPRLRPGLSGAALRLRARELIAERLIGLKN